MSNVEDTGGREPAEGLRKQRRAVGAARRRAAAKDRPPAEPCWGQVVAVEPADIDRFAALHQKSQAERLRFADMAASAMQQLAPQLLAMGEANKEVRGVLTHLAEKYRITPEERGADAVWELLPAEGGFVRRDEVPEVPVPPAPDTPDDP